MYIDYSLKKLMIVIVVVSALSLCVYATFMYKFANYGISTFDQAGRWAIGGPLRYLAYELRLGGAGLAASPMGARSAASNAHANARAIPVLTYHGVERNTSDEYRFELSRFEDHMISLKQAGWQTVTLSEFQEYMDGERSLPERSFLLTFDDGAKISYYPVDPLLSALDYTALAFIHPIYSAATGTTYYLSKGEIRNMIDTKRWEIGSHGMAFHIYQPIDAKGTLAAPMGNLLFKPESGRNETPEEYAARVEHDLTDSKRTLEEAFNLPVQAFSFPFGEFGHLSINYPEAKDVAPALAKEEYQEVFYQWWPGEGYTFNYPESGQTMWKRVEPRTDSTGTELVALLERGNPKPLPFTASFEADQGWISTWGKVMVADNSLVLAPNPNETGAASILDGTADWKDYRIDVMVESPRQTGFAIYGRYANERNHALCNFGNEFIHVEQVFDGERRVIKGLREGDMMPDGMINASMQISGRTVICTMGEYSVETPFLEEPLSSGGVGLKTWNEVSDLSSLIVHEFRVAPNEGFLNE